MLYEEFQKIYDKLPHDVALYYSHIKIKFNLSHEQAYFNTLTFANMIGKTAGNPGMPGSACSKRLLLRSEI